MRDELNEPLGLGPNRFPPAASGGAGFLAAAAALVALGAVLGEIAVLRGAPAAGGISAPFAERPIPPADPPPLRLTAAKSADPPAKPLPAADLGEGATPAQPKSLRHRGGAPEPLIIDVQRALAALRAKDLAAAER